MGCVHAVILVIIFLVCYAKYSARTRGVFNGSRGGLRLPSFQPTLIFMMVFFCHCTNLFFQNIKI